MIQLNSNSLVFEMANGDAIPCSAEQVTIDLIGEAVNLVDPEVIRQAAAAVLHYFKVEQGRDYVSVMEFSQALTRVLRGFGFDVSGPDAGAESLVTDESDLRQLACDSGKGYELTFFPMLRGEVRRRLGEPRRVLRFRGLRSCVKQLVGARRWSRRCEVLSDQIVDYLRGCLGTEAAANQRLLVVQ